MAREHPVDRHPAVSHPSEVRPNHASLITFVLIAMALVLAIGFFYVTKVDRSDEQASALTVAAESADNAATAVGEAARKTADSFRRDP